MIESQPGRGMRFMESRSDQHKPQTFAQGGSLFDYDRSLARLGGDPALFEEIVTLFLEDCPQLLRQARSAWSEGDLETLARTAHSLKNLTANFDASAAMMAAATVEQRIQDRALAHVDLCLSEMERELGRLQSALARRRAAHEA
jgi:HPt (histidine-containing phosphotransfer) domain-containing protein